MLTFALRRLLLAIPTLLFISLVIFLLLEASPGDPLGEVPLTVPPEVKERMREALGLGQAWYIRYVLWLKQFFWVEPLYWFDQIFGTSFSEGMQRIISYQSRQPVFDVIAERLPQTLTVVGMSYLLGVLIAIPIGIVSAYRQYSWFDQLGTFVSMVGFSLPTFFTGVVFIIIFGISFPMWLSLRPDAMFTGALTQSFLIIGFTLMGVTFGPMGALLPELFPTNVRYTGSAISYNVSSILGAAVAPFIATWLAATYGPGYVGIYLLSMAILTFVSCRLIPETRDRDLTAMAK